MNSDKSATKSGLVGRYLTVLHVDLKMSCWALLASVQWTTTLSGLACQFSQNRCHLDLDDSAASLNTVGRDKKSATVRQAKVPTNFNPN